MTALTSIANAAVPLWVTVLTTIGGGTATFVYGYFFLSKKDRNEFTQKKYENSIKIRDDHNAHYTAYVEALRTHATARTSDSFVTLCRCGDAYFNQLARMCDTILAGKADEGMRDNTWLPAIKDALERSLPLHYSTLQADAKKLQLPYNGKLRRKNHESIYAVAEKFGGTAVWLRPHEDD